MKDRVKEREWSIDKDTGACSIKTFFFVIFGHFSVNYGIFAINEQIYGQNLAITTNP